MIILPEPRMRDIRAQRLEKERYVRTGLITRIAACVVAVIWFVWIVRSA